MWTIINFLANTATALEILFLFTCGQGYMRLSAARSRRSFDLTRILYLAIAAAAVISALFNSRIHPAESLGNLALSLLLSVKCYSALRHTSRWPICRPCK